MIDSLKGIEKCKTSLKAKQWKPENYKIDDNVFH